MRDRAKHGKNGYAYNRKRKGRTERSRSDDFGDDVGFGDSINLDPTEYGAELGAMRLE